MLDPNLKLRPRDEQNREIAQIILGMTNIPDDRKQRLLELVQELELEKGG